ncbi:fatty acid desaturase [Yoonia sp. F2084L]|uniref:fatty acid desaturase n=1 Tax=Yoonia sp. F2084L TaxID=2926419 RepID=UPI001FF41496|nr:fatty acid desaturase [Yoonia sp. F2084L]MCK0096429.1 fatty acid desaturase [Yoonia sp. F2084L]
MGQKKSGSRAQIAWPTVILIAACYGTWALALWVLPLWAGIAIAGLAIALHASLQHEVIHGHPFQHQWLNDMLIWPPLVLFIPYVRYKATHLAHHHDEVITDPFDDPESNYLDAGVWERLPWSVKAILRMNNTVAGRLTLGPMIGTIAFAVCEWRKRDAEILRGWLIHLPAVIAVLAVVVASPMPLWAYLIAAYAAMSILKLRTFLEHQAHERASGRSVIVERGGLLAFLFLNNNLHVVHHMHPRVAWYALPALYRARKDHYLRRNGGYYFASYRDVIRKYLWKAKDPVAHPLWRR